MNVRTAINRRLTGGGNCPTRCSLGECAAVYETQGWSRTGRPSKWWIACLYLWPAAHALKPAEVATWFEELGALDVSVSAVLHDPDNDIVNGASTHDGVRPWDVKFRLPNE
jgi:hypothetical protein